MQKLTVNHSLNDILLIGDKIPVPLINIKDPIRGVLFKSNGTNFPIDVVSTSTFTENNTRYGPEVKVSINSEVNYLQEAFLAENVTFSGDSQKLHFNYKTESRSKYTFNGLIIDFVNENKKVDFKGKYIKLLIGDIRILIWCLKLNLILIFNMNFLLMCIHMHLSFIRCFPMISFSPIRGKKKKKRKMPETC